MSRPRWLTPVLATLLALAGFVAAELVPVAAADDEEALDTDGDRIPDRTELRTGTDPLRTDTDADGVPDGVEDLDRDGRVDRHDDETDPRRPGLFPGTAPHVPEPMVFDLVRGLGSRRGELEANALVLVHPREGHVHWAPEVEWAFAKGHAIELELPMVDRRLEAVKVALQGTLPQGGGEDLAHGWQVFGEVGLDHRQTDAVLLYLFAHRPGGPWSYLLTTGGKTTASKQGLLEGAGLLNASVFFDAREWVTLGVESNTRVSRDGERQLRLFPQVHVQVSRHVRFQVSAGVELGDDGPAPVFGTRIIME